MYHGERDSFGISTRSNGAHREVVFHHPNLISFLYILGRIIAVDDSERFANANLHLSQILSFRFLKIKYSFEQSIYNQYATHQQMHTTFWCEWNRPQTKISSKRAHSLYPKCIGWLEPLPVPCLKHLVLQHTDMYSHLLVWCYHWQGFCKIKFTTYTGKYYSE